MFIKEVKARAIKDSRNEETIEVSINNAEAASSPSGKSTGKYESKPYYKSLKWNVDFLSKWNKEIEINSFDDLTRIEMHIKKELKIKDIKLFGGNALFAFESAILKALAKENKKELWQVINPKVRKFPVPVGNAVGGGLHTKGKVKPLFQEFLLIPREKSFRENVESMEEIYTSIGRMLKASNVNDEGAWQTDKDDEEILELMRKFASNTFIGVDAAASTFYDKLYKHRSIDMTRPAHIGHMISRANNYKLLYFEDPVEEEDYEGFAEIKKNVKDCMIVGDDLTATHLNRLKKAIEMRSINAMIVKPNQNGSLLEVREIVEFCKKHSIKTIMSHRSGETLDDALADYAFAFGTDYIKCGIATKWRECKLQRMIEIERSL